MNAWFPKINAGWDIASGNSGIWISDATGSRQVSPVGIGPIWAGKDLIYNRNDGTTFVNGAVISIAYNDYAGSDDSRWAGFIPGQGQIDVYWGTSLMQSIPKGCAPRFGVKRFAYLLPYQPDAPYYQRSLIVDGTEHARGVINDVRVSRDGSFFVYQIATSTYGRAIYDDVNRLVSIRNDEAPLVAFTGPGGEPWMMTGTPTVGTFVRPLNSPFGYLIAGDLYYPDARICPDGRLRVVGSYSNGAPRFDIYIDFNAPRMDLSKLIEPVPPDPPIPPDPPDPVPEPPKPKPPKPERPYLSHKEWHMTDVVGVVRGPGGKLGRPDERNTGPWAGLNRGWRGFVFDGENDKKADERYHFVRPAAKQNALVSKQTGAVAGCDATLHSGALNKQFYLKPDGEQGQGWAEEWKYYDGNANGAIEVQVEYAPGRGGDDGPFFSYPLAFEAI